MTEELGEKFDRALNVNIRHKVRSKRRNRSEEASILDEKHLSKAHEERRKIRRNAALKWIGLLTASGALWLVGNCLSQLSKVGKYALTKADSSERMAAKIRAKYGRNAKNRNFKKKKRKSSKKTAQKTKNIFDQDRKIRGE